MTRQPESSKDSNLGSEQTDNNINFGSLLAEARKARNFTVEEISENLKIPVRTIVALEANDNASLPAPTFTQGYIRAYAKFLEMSEHEVLTAYNRAVPHENTSDLKPRSTLPNEANSQSPLIKTITLLLIVSVIAAIGFGGFRYYQKKANVMENELEAKQQNFTGDSLDSPGAHRLSIKQDVRVSDDALAADTNKRGTFEHAVELTGSRNADVTADAIEAIEAKAEYAQSKTGSDVDNHVDTIEIFAENGSWVEVRDANKSRLLYNMLPVGGSRVLVGRAPFSVTMGNAKTTRVVVNDIEVDVSDYIRSTNTASFKVSTQGQNVIFH